MQNVKSAGGCLLAALAVSAIAASSASAALPELGRCQAVEKVQEGKKASYHGAFRNDKCTKTSAMKKGKYEWAPGPGADDTFTAEAIEGVTFETVGGQRVECEGGALKGGEYTGAKTEKFSSINLDECETSTGTVCQTNPKEVSEIEDPNTVEGELGPIGGAKPTAGWVLKSLLFAFTCGTLPEVESIQTIEGSVIGAVARGSLSGGASSDLDIMSTGTKVAFKQATGMQLPEAFEGGAKDTLSTTRIVGLSKSVEQTGLGGDVTEHYGEPLEIRTKEEGS
jgi:hypothetical protein